MELANSSTTALAVDLDGTLIRGDMFHLSLRYLLLRNPLRVCLFPLWLLRGKAVFKREVARRVSIDPETLDFRTEVLDFVRDAQSQGRPTVLATGSDSILAQAVFDHLGCFDGLIASDGQVNNTGRKKSEALVSRFGESGFDYIGNSAVDIPIWERAAGVMLAGHQPGLLESLRERFEVQRVFP